jgi:hypothetical protein
MAVQQVTDIETILSSRSSLSASGWIKSFRQRIGTWLNTSADYYAAAAHYEQFRGLSDAELRRRGFSRAMLARDVCSCMRPDGSRLSN